MLISRGAWTLSLFMMFMDARMVSSQDYPSKPVRIVTSGAGGSADFVARMIAQGISGPLGQQVIVDNRTSGVIPGQVVSKSAPDGYTLIVVGNSFWMLKLLQDNVPYDSEKDFVPIVLATKAPNVLVVHPSVPVKSVKELIALAKSRPGELNYTTSGTGGATHLGAELFKSMAHVNIVRIQYKTGSQEAIDLTGGHVQLTFGSAATYTPLVKAGKLKALAVTAAQPTPLFPGLPTIAATLPGYEAVQVNALFAPAQTPDAIIRRLNQETVRLLGQPEVKEKFFSTGMDVVGSSPEQLAAAVKSELTVMGKVIKDAGIRAN